MRDSDLICTVISNMTAQYRQLTIARDECESLGQQGEHDTGLDQRKVLTKTIARSCAYNQLIKTGGMTSRTLDEGEEGPWVVLFEKALRLEHLRLGPVLGIVVDCL
jgi:hypothetical protein